MKENDTLHRILFAEDVSTDFEIVERLLKQEGFSFTSVCVDTETDFLEQLRVFNPTLILSDYCMPTFTGMKALKIAQAEKPDVPFIILTGSMNEDVAVECMKNGADDYVIKQNLKRLIPSIRSALEKKALQFNEKKAIQELERSELRYRLLVENTPNAVALINNRKTLFINKKFKEFLEYSIEEINHPDFDRLSILTAKYRNNIQTIIPKNKLVLNEVFHTHVEIESKSGKTRYCELALFPFVYKGLEYIQAILKDISLQKELINRNAMLSRVLEQSPVGIVITNKEAEIEYANPSFLNNTGYSFDELIGKNPRILKSGKHDKAFYEDMWDKLVRDEIWKGEIFNKKKNGDIYPENLTISPIFNSEGELAHYVALKEDVSELKNHIAELNKAKEKAEESDRLKSAFLANVSHEIRTPMNGILGFSELLKEPKLSGEQQQKYIQIIEKSGARMLNIINDIVSISKIESGTVKVHLSEININEQLQFIYDSLIIDANQKQIQLSFTCDLPEKKAMITTDSKMFSGILSNLVKNAIKYTDKGSIEFGYINKAEKIEFYVKDTGIGISKEKTDVIFERFIQADITDKMARQGAGLGLAISKAYTYMLNGKIWVESELGVGSTFYFELPIKTGEKQTTPTKTIPIPTNDSEQIKDLKILVAEDVEVNFEYIKIVLNKTSETISWAKNGKEAVELYTNEKFDLILMDLKMPEMDGYEATAQILKRYPNAKIIAQTAYASLKEKTTCLQSGFEDYISKPFKKSTLIDVILKTMGNVDEA